MLLTSRTLEGGAMRSGPAHYPFREAHRARRIRTPALKTVAPPLCSPIGRHRLTPSDKNLDLVKNFPPLDILRERAEHGKG
jgi:hypothetical protein